jgi:hypothetical protein
MKNFWYFISFSVLDKKGKKLRDDFCFHSITCNENDINLDENDFLEACKKKVGEDVIILINNVNSI